MKDNWDYFHNDIEYQKVLLDRLHNKFEMETAKNLSENINLHTKDNEKLNILDIGSGPGHYYSTLKRILKSKLSSYRGLDLLESHVNAGNKYFENNPNVFFEQRDICQNSQISDDYNCLISANTIPHIPSIYSLLKSINKSKLKFIFFRMLIGTETVIIKKIIGNLENKENLENNQIQLNNIYSLNYIKSILGNDWDLKLVNDNIINDKLNNHINDLKRDSDPNYSNRITKIINGMQFKGEVYMPWKYLIGIKVENI